MRIHNVIGDNKKWLQKYITIMMLLVVLLPVASAITYPTLNGYVTDNADIITPEYREKITDLADRINKNTTVEIAVLTIESLEGDSPENYALQTFRQNGVGKKDNNNGLLILVAKNERKYKFEVGYGLEGTIPDAMKVPIGDKIITPNFRNGDYGKGIYESMIVIEGLLTNNTEVLSKYGMIQNSGGEQGGGEGGGEGGGDAIFTIIVIVIIGIFGIIFIFAMINRRTYSSPSPSLPTTYRPPPYTRSSGSGSSRSTSSSSSSSSTRRRSSSSGYSSGSSSHSHSSGHSFGGGFGGFGGGRSGGGGFGGGW